MNEMVDRAEAAAHEVLINVGLDVPKIVRAVMKAMREPTNDMKIAAVSAVGEHRQPMVEKLKADPSPGWCVHALYGSKESDAVWRAMIDAALASA